MKKYHNENCWLAELLTEGCEFHPNDSSRPINMADFKTVCNLAMDVLPNNNILNLISKAKIQPYRQTLINLYNTVAPVTFIESIDAESRKTFETPYLEPASGVTVFPLFIQSGNP